MSDLHDKGREERKLYIVLTTTNKSRKKKGHVSVRKKLELN